MPLRTPSIDIAMILTTTSLPPNHVVHHDSISNHPLGTSSHVSKDGLLSYLNDNAQKPKITVHINAQSNNSPHMGTIATFAVAFFIAAKLRDEHNREVTVTLVLVDTASSEQVTINGVLYQRGQRSTEEQENYLSDIRYLLDSLSARTGIEYCICNQQQFLSSAPNLQAILSEVVSNREKLARDFALKSQNLAIRAACPYDECGLVDKHGIKTEYTSNAIAFLCPHHGRWFIHLGVNGAAQLSTMDFSTLLRNFIRAKIFTSDPTTSWIHVTGGDYAGCYQEQLLRSHLDQQALVVYSPQILDWSGAKLSKSLYVQEQGYTYMAPVGHFLSLKIFREQGKNLDVVFNEVSDWVNHPHRLFRSYPVTHFQGLFRGGEPANASL